MKATNWQARANGIKVLRAMDRGKKVMNLLTLVLAVQILNSLFNFVPMTGMQILATFMILLVISLLVADIVKQSK
jgi:hypothetical protein